MKKIIKQDGFNESERYLANLCEKTFLSLWSYPNVYTNEGKKSANGDGKELCDLLVVFGNHVIIFSDKDISFKDSGDLEVDWGRWVKKAVLKSALQLYGAENWIIERPERVFLDPKCQIPFPLEMPSPDQIKIHRVAVAKNATKRFSLYVQGSGSLIINPEIKGNEHLKNPFMVGIPVENKPFIHVFDDIALDIVLYELDTISDFIGYLESKEAFINSGGLISAAGEEELLAYYLMSSKKGSPAGFYIEDGQKAIILDGHYEGLKNLPQYSRGKEYDRGSYFWDEFIEHFSKHALGGTLLSENESPFSDISLALRVMASERRTARRILSGSILEKLRDTPADKRAVRVMVSPTNPEYGYIWLAEPIPIQAKTYEDYRHYRKELLYVYCTSAKLLFSKFKIIVGIATEQINWGGGEDMLYLDTTTWRDEDFKRAEDDRNKLKILLPEGVRRFEGTEYQYPVIESDYVQEKRSSRNIDYVAAKIKRVKKAQKKAKKINRRSK
ncbi:hypothetical protein WF070_002268 [Yersinia enterocolitica]